MLTPEASDQAVIGYEEQTASERAKAASERLTLWLNIQKASKTYGKSPHLMGKLTIIL